MNSRGCHRWWFWHSWFRHVCTVRALPKWYVLLRRHMIQTNKSTPLPHNSLSLHLLSSSSCCHQPSSFFFFFLHTNEHTSRSRSSVAKGNQTVNESVMIFAALGEFGMYRGHFNILVVVVIGVLSFFFIGSLAATEIKLKASQYFITYLIIHKSCSID